MKSGLVLEGGGMKGVYTAGVIDVLVENNIEFDVSIGVSAGVAFGCNYKSKQIGRAIRYILKYRHNWKFGSFRSWILTGNYFGQKFCYRDIPLKYDLFDKETFKKNKNEFYAVATNLETGKAEYFKLTDGEDLDLRWIQASASVPILSRIQKINGQKYLDGGMACSIPIHKSIELGCKKHLVVMTKPLEYSKDDAKFLPLIKLIYIKYPNFIDTCADCDNQYHRELGKVLECQKQGNAFIIRPSRLITINSAENDLSKLKALYELGREDTEKVLPQLKEFLAD